MKKLTAIRLEEYQKKHLDNKAEEERISVSKVIRDLIDKDVLNSKK